MLNELENSNAPVNEQLFFSITAQSLLSANLKSEHFLNCLIDNHCFSDAITFLAHSLGCKDGIGWAKNCVNKYSENLSTNDNYLLSSTTNWLKNPTTKNRHCVLPKKMQPDSTPATWVALAAYWSEGIIEGENIDSLEMPVSLVNDAIYSAVMLMMKHVPQEEQYRIYILVINDGIEMLANSRAN